MRGEQYVERAAEAILALVETERAVVLPEIEAKLAERRVSRFDPDILTRARRALVQDGELDSAAEPTKGGRVIRAYFLPGPTKTVDRTAGRKRALHARYLSWASIGATGHTNLVSTALEDLTRKALDACEHYQSLGPGVSLLLGTRLRGELDVASTRTVLDLQTGALTGPFVLPVECKNIRSWIYPRHLEVHQLLSKAAALQLAHPDRSLVPVLVCRRAHTWTNHMARHLGFYVISTVRQYIRPRVTATEDDQRRFDEVRKELGYNLVVQTDPPSPLVAHFASTLPPLMQRTADRWRTTADFEPTFRRLASRDLDQTERTRLTGDLAAAAAAAYGDEYRWHHQD